MRSRRRPARQVANGSVWLTELPGKLHAVVVQIAKCNGRGSPVTEMASEYAARSPGDMSPRSTGKAT